MRQREHVNTETPTVGVWHASIGAHVGVIMRLNDRCAHDLCTLVRRSKRARMRAHVCTCARKCASVLRCTSVEVYEYRTFMRAQEQIHDV